MRCIANIVSLIFDYNRYFFGNKNVTYNKNEALKFNEKGNFD
jgi:hypothetical protein